MFVVVDYNSKIVYGPASYEMRKAWESKKPGTPYLIQKMFGFECKVIVEERHDLNKMISDSKNLPKLEERNDNANISSVSKLRP